MVEAHTAARTRMWTCVHILPDPVQGLSFPRAVDVLSSALGLVI